jgi:hypothetical protein
MIARERQIDVEQNADFRFPVRRPLKSSPGALALKLNSLHDFRVRYLRNTIAHKEPWASEHGVGSCRDSFKLVLLQRERTNSIHLILPRGVIRNLRDPRLVKRLGELRRADL